MKPTNLKVLDAIKQKNFSQNNFKYFTNLKNILIN